MAAHEGVGAPDSLARRRLRPLGRMELDRRLASGLERVVLDAETPRPRFSAAVPALLSDGAGPIFLAHAPDALRDAVRRAAMWVEAV